MQGQASSHLQIKVILYHVELNTYSLFSRSNTRIASPQTCHMLPLDQIKHRSNSGTIQASNLFDFHEWAYKTWGMTRCTKQVLSKECMHANQLLPWIARRRGMPYKWRVHQHIFEKSNMFNSFLSLQNLFSSNGLVNMLASWSSVPTLSIEMSPLDWWSLIKWWWMSMFFIL